MLLELHRLLDHATPALLIGTSVALGAIASNAEVAEAATLVTSRAALGAGGTTDQVNWSAAGPIFNPFGPPNPSVFLPSSFTVLSGSQQPVQVDIPSDSTAGVLPPFVFQTTPEPGIATNFSKGDFVLLSGLKPGPPPAVGNPGPITLSFAKPVLGAGAQIAVDDTANFIGTVSAFDREGQLLGAFSAPGASSLALDNSALFLGVLEDQPKIAKLEFKSSIPARAMGLNQLDIVMAESVPEPSALIALAVLAGVGLGCKESAV